MEVGASSDPGARRYRIAALLGKGTSGRIYRAVLEEPNGQETDVAVKLLRDEDVASITLKRFREEADLVGGVRDRAIVRVEPPVKLADQPGKAGTGKWALVMDLVTGASLQRLTSLGAMPPSVATEIVGEVARVLEKAWRATGADGQRLRILHRDIKPSNLQLSVSGVIRVLDFGIAKADYKTRDAQVTLYGTGTRGFIAPERLEGTESPAGDVFSLGVTAHALIGGDRSRRKDETTEEIDQAMIALFNRMRSPVSAERPTAVDVEEECTRLRQQSDGMTLRDWAERNVPRAIALTFSDEVVGSVLVETETSPRTTRAPASRAPLSTRPPAEPRGLAWTGGAPPSQGRSDDEETVVASRESYLASIDSEPTPLPLPGRANTPSVSQRPSSRAAPSLAPQSAEPTPMPLPQRTNPPVAAQQRTNPPVAAPRPMPRATPSLAPESAEPTPMPLPERTNPPVPAVRPPEAGAGRSSRAPASIPPPPPSRAPSLPPSASAAATPLLPPTPVRSPPVEDDGGGLRWFVGVLAMGALVMAGGMVIGVAGGAGVWWMWPAPVVARHSTSLPPPQTEPLPVDVTEIEAPAPPAPRTLTFSSIPLGADVYVDRKPVGQTPVTGLVVSEGAHEVILVSDFEKLRRPIEVGKKKPIRYVWRGGDEWELHF